MSYKIGDIITSQDFNQIREDVGEVFNDRNSGIFPYIVADSSFGYGQPHISSQVAPGDIITIEEWTNLFDELFRCAIHQGTSGGDDIDQTPTAGDLIVAYEGTEGLLQLVQDVRANKLTFNSGSFQVTAGGTFHTESFSGILTDQASPVIYQYRVLFDNMETTRYYFNTGGQFIMSMERANGSQSFANTSWSNAMSDIGDIVFGWNETTSTGTVGTASNIGLYDLTTTFQTIFIHDNIVGNELYGAPDQIVLKARRGQLDATAELLFKLELHFDSTLDAGGTIDGDINVFLDQRTPQVHINLSDEGTYQGLIGLPDGGGQETPPIVNFTFAQGSADFIVDFTDASSDTDGTIQSWSWDFGDSNTSTTQNPSHTYGSDGTYDVTLTVTDDDGLSSSTTKSLTLIDGILVDALPDASFTFTVDGLDATFTDTSTTEAGVNITNWAWDFGDGNTSTQQNPTHTYTSEGTYNVSLTITTDQSEVDSVTDSVAVSSNAPTANFDFIRTQSLYSSISDGRATVKFFDLSTDPDGSIATTEWNFGDGSLTSTDSNPMHAYDDLSDATTIDVTLTVKDNSNLTDSVTKTVTLSPLVGLDTSFNTTSLDVDFTDLTKILPSETIEKWFWRFGDGTTSTQQNPTHTYPSLDATYHATLFVTTDSGRTGSRGVLFSLGSGDSTYPNPSFSYTTTNLDVTFSDISSDTDGTIQSWSWDFGDGNTSTQQNPTHTYASEGDYAVQLTVTDNDSKSWTRFEEITVKSGVSFGNGEEPPYVDFVVTNISGLDVTFNDASWAIQSNDWIDTWSWDFGDGGTSTEENPTHTYSTTGTFNVTLTATDNNGLSESITKSITVS